MEKTPCFIWWFFLFFWKKQGKEDQRSEKKSLNSDSNGFWPCDSNRAMLNRCEPMAIQIAANPERRFETSKRLPNLELSVPICSLAFGTFLTLLGIFFSDLSFPLSWLITFSRPQKGPAERGHVRRRQKSSKSVQTNFDFFRQFSHRAKTSKMSEMSLFDNFRAAAIFRTLLGLGGLWKIEEDLCGTSSKGSGMHSGAFPKRKRTPLVWERPRFTFSHFRVFVDLLL